MIDREREILVEAVCSPFRERDPLGRVLPSPAWWDLSPTDREIAFDAQLAARRLERALDAEGFSGSARAVLSRAGELPQLEP